MVMTALPHSATLLLRACSAPKFYGERGRWLSGEEMSDYSAITSWDFQYRPTAHILTADSALIFMTRCIGTCGCSIMDRRGDLMLYLHLPANRAVALKLGRRMAPATDVLHRAERERWQDHRRRHHKAIISKAPTAIRAARNAKIATYRGFKTGFLPPPPILTLKLRQENYQHSSMRFQSLLSLEKRDFSSFYVFKMTC